MTSSFVILDMEAIYGYVSGTPQEGAREERHREGERQRERERGWGVRAQRLGDRGGGHWGTGEGREVQRGDGEDEGKEKVQEERG